MMDNDKAARQEKISEDFSPGAPLHVNRVIEVRSETRDGDNVRYDPATAHFRANDRVFSWSLEVDTPPYIIQSAV